MYQLSINNLNIKNKFTIKYYINFITKLFNYNLIIHFILLIIIFNLTICETKRIHNTPLLIEDDGIQQRNNNRNLNSNNRQAVSECQFGKTFQELGSTWYADLGPPFGIMYCIKCECVAVPKKRRIVARVQCRNIKNECPPANCDDPVLLPGKCCKTCPGDDDEIPQDHPVLVTNEEEERNMKHFSALLTGRTSQFLKRDEMKSMYSTNNPQNFIATARFTFHKKNLYYSFYVSHKTFRPRSIQFIDETGTILEEHNLMNNNNNNNGIPSSSSSLNGPVSLYQNTTGKICGVWKRIPRDYKRLLRDERMHVVLIWGGKYQSELALAGRITKYTALATEMFSSLLEPAIGTKPDQMAGAGGTAIVSISSGQASSIHLMIIFNGIFNPDDFIDIPINIRVELPEKKEIILDEIQKVKKPSTDINVLEVSSPISIQNLRLLSRGKMVLSVESRKNPLLKIQGHIITRATCELFQTLLTPNNFESKTKTSGLAWVYLNTDGSLVYNIQTDSLDLLKYPEISLMEDNGKRKTLLEDLTQSLNYDQAIGTIDKLSPRVLESLYAEELAVNIAINHDPSILKGKLLQRPVADATDSFEPILLKRLDLNTPAHIMGMAWLSIDNECNLHYELTINGFFNTQQIFQVYLEEKPIEALGAPVTRKLLDEFTGAHKEGFIIGMALSELVKLETSVCYLEIYAKNRNELLLRGKLKSTKVPSHCFPMYTDNNVPSVIVPNHHGDSHYIQPETKCYHSGRFYDEAEQWKSIQESCTMCTCQHGHVVCDPIKCPTVNCRVDEERILRQGECCVTCISPKLMIETNNSAERGCYLGDQFHLAGATWHPYLPPNGFDTCTTCTCDPISLEIHCPRLVCPPLTCPEKIAFRQDKKACCKVCPEGKMNYYGNDKVGSNNPNVLHDQEIIKEPIKTAEEILAKGGCKAVNTVYENGQEWHPVLASHGEQKCIKCRCKDSVVTCDRRRCTRSVCNNRVTMKRKGSADSGGSGINGSGLTASNTHEIDECCKSNQCRRLRRHHNHRHNNKDRNHQKMLSSSSSSSLSSSLTNTNLSSADQR